MIDSRDPGPGHGPSWTTSLPEVVESDGFGPVDNIVIEGDDEVSKRLCVGCVRCVRETGGRENVDPLLLHLGGSRSSRWAYVGEGQGHFEKGQSYSYVGQGAGAFEKDVVGSGRSGWWTSMRRPCCVLFLVVAIPLAVVGVLASTGKDQVLLVNQKAAKDSPATSTIAPAYQCAEGEAWTPEEEEFCCRSPGGRCTTTGAPRLSISDSTEFNCDLGLRRWRLAWPTKKKLWCCAHRQRGCLPGMPRRPPPTPAPSTTSPAPAPAPSTTKQKQAPSTTKQKQALVEVLATSAPKHARATPAPHDCDSGEEEKWSESKRKWCCKGRGRGCSYDCLQSYFNWKAAWSERKREWCCKHEERGCLGGHQATDAGMPGG